MLDLIAEGQPFEQRPGLRPGAYRRHSGGTWECSLLSHYSWPGMTDWHCSLGHTCNNGKNRFSQVGSSAAGKGREGASPARDHRDRQMVEEERAGAEA